MKISASRGLTLAGRLIGPAVGLAGLALAVAGYGCFWMGEEAGQMARYRVLAYPGIALMGLGAALIYRARVDRPDARRPRATARRCPTCGRSNPPDAWYCADCEGSLEWEPDRPAP